MKMWMKGLMIALMMMGVNLASGQIVVDTARLHNAVEELAMLKEVDKSSLSRAEKKAWKAEKKALKQVINEEESKLRFLQEMEFAWRYGYPYGYGYGWGMNAWGGWGVNPWIWQARRPVVVVRRAPVCRVPRVRR